MASKDEEINDIQKKLGKKEDNDQSSQEYIAEEDFNKETLEIFKNLDYPKCPKKLEKINLDKLLNYSVETEINDPRNEDLSSFFHLITSHSFNTYSVSSGLNKIKFLKDLKEENSKSELNYQVNTPSSNNVQKSEILITEDLDSLIKGVKSIPYIPKLEKMAPLPKRDINTSSSKKKKRNKRKRKNEKDRHYNENKDDRSLKSRKLVKNWDDKTIEDYESFDIEDRENSFESILNQYNSMKQPPKDIIHINQILNQPIHAETNKEILNTDEKKISLPSPSSPEINNKEDIMNLSQENSTKLMNDCTPSLLDNKIEDKIVEKSKDEEKNKLEKKEDINKDTSFNFLKNINKEVSDMWNKDSPLSSNSSNSSVSNMSDEEINYSQSINHKKHILENLRYSSILTPPTPPQPLEEN
ncbi:hypothetical protein BCR36DRAFT_586044 [Piromyces finnis]|uniref:Uncharacterized protein n=1 Tax=Piromyces finnis TaxID=1754191 RepID=A0A1Y1V0L1_9FUNG|nr:hypothetical protein BCR36DRAFT_586044 [Piromyces finnis]|eukprot:ORX44676.1 hypothetical protein BCR36DRAFT_586044 [Piromyces finnis]